MTTIYDMARELGKTLLASEESLRLSDAQAACEDEEAGRLAADYEVLVNQVLSIILSEAGIMDKSEKNCSGCAGCKK